MRLFPASLAFIIALFAASYAAAAAPAAGPQIARLEIEIWPEYDRPQSLVILKGELAPDTRLPAAIALRIPATAGQPSAVAYIDESGKLMNLDHQRQLAGPFVLVRLTTPQRSFHLEFYEPLLANEAQREYRYTWPGDLAVQKLGVLVKEPAAATELSISPPLGVAGAGPDGLRYHAAELGALKAGEQKVVTVRYTKTDPRSSTEILAARSTAAPPAQAGARTTWWWVTLAAIVLGVLGLIGVAVALWPRRKSAVAAVTAQRKCRKCGRAAAPADRFCAGCGAALKS